MSQPLAPKLPSRGVITARMELLSRDPVPGQGPSTAAECIAQVVELAALHALLQDRRGCVQAAERIFPGVVARLRAFAKEGGR